MSSVAVIYKSKYGSTKKYAEWIANALDAELFEVSSINLDKLSKFDTIIYGGGLYEDRIKGAKFISENFQTLKNKTLIVYSVGLGSTNDKEAFEPMINKNFTLDMRKDIQFYHYQGGIDYSKLSFMDRMAMKLFYKFIARKKVEETSEEAKMMLATYGKNVDYTDKQAIEPLISYIKEINIDKSDYIKV